MIAIVPSKRIKNPMLPKLTQKDRFDLTKTHDEIISSILMELKEGNLQHLATWETLLIYYKTFHWSRKVASEKIKEIMKDTIMELQQSIEENHSPSMVLLACMHRLKWDCALDKAKTIELLDKAIASGNTDAKWIYLGEYAGSIEDYEKAIEDMDNAVALGNTYAMCRRANIHRLDCNYEAEIDLLEKAVALGNSDAMIMLAIRHIGTSIPKAVELLEQAIALGNSSAFFHRASLYNWKEDYTNAINLLEQAIALGSPNAMYARARMHEYGLGGNIDLKRAARLWRLVAQLGHYTADKFSLHATDSVVGYHCLMVEDKIKDALAWILEKEEVFGEWLEFGLVHDKDSATMLESVTEALIEKNRFPDLMKLLCALDKVEKDEGIFFSSDIKLKLVSARICAQTKDDEFKKLAEILVDEWCKEGDQVLEPVAALLSRLFQSKKKAELKEIDSKTFTKLSMLILLKAIYGNDIDINVSFQPSTEQLVILSCFFAHDIKCPIDILFEHVLKAPEALYQPTHTSGPPEQSGTRAPGNIGFFSLPAKSENSESYVAPETFLNI